LFLAVRKVRIKANGGNDLPNECGHAFTTTVDVRRPGLSPRQTLGTNPRLP
jgi:hypothetical protein